MPIKRRTPKERIAGLSETATAFFLDAPLPANHNKWEAWSLEFNHEEGSELWHTHKPELLAAFVTAHPGARPRMWWRYDSREPRRRLGGVGTPSSEVLATVPSFDRGIPSSWVSEFEELFYRGLAVDVHGEPIGSQFLDSGFAGVAPDPDDPPVFESQASFLKRHSLFVPGEEKRLKPEDFEPEAVTIDLDALINNPPIARDGDNSRNLRPDDDTEE